MCRSNGCIAKFEIKLFHWLEGYVLLLLVAFELAVFGRRCANEVFHGNLCGYMLKRAAARVYSVSVVL